jgi:hypothetical protein
MPLHAIAEQATFPIAAQCIYDKRVHRPQVSFQLEISRDCMSVMAKL